MQKHCSIQILGIKRLLKATLKGIPLPMRLLIIMLCVSIGCIRATNTYAQNAILDLKVNNQTIETVLKIIESRTDFVFFFNSQQVNVHKRVSINVNKQNIFKILDEVFKGSDVVYSVLDKSIILSSKRFAPDGNLKKITGKVVDTNGEPLIGVTIALKGSNRGTVSDVNGNFSLNGEEGKLNVLNISYIGYKDQQVKVEDGKTLIITLEEDTKVLEEVVVVGYGTQKKINLTGAVAVVDDKQVIGRSADNLSKLLQGAVPNMNVTVSNGRPGQGGSINIRGINSISSSATPLILVDGVEGTIDAVNPNDVESISVLKDASSAAVYGARAAYGVILAHLQFPEILRLAVIIRRLSMICFILPIKVLTIRIIMMKIIMKCGSGVMIKRKIRNDRGWLSKMVNINIMVTLIGITTSWMSLVLHGNTILVSVVAIRKCTISFPVLIMIRKELFGKIWIVSLNTISVPR